MRELLKAINLEVVYCIRRERAPLDWELPSEETRAEYGRIAENDPWTVEFEEDTATIIDWFSHRGKA